MIFQIFLVLFATLFVGRTFRQYRRQKVSFMWLIDCCVFAFGIVVVALRPEVTTMAAGFVGIGRGADLVIYVSLAVLFTAVFFLTSSLDRVEREMTELVRKIAVENAEQGKKK